MRRLAELLEPVEAETPMGGLAVSYEPLGFVWLSLQGRRLRTSVDPGAERTEEVARAEARVDPRLTVGRVLRLDGADWRVRLMAADEVGGRVRLELERTR